MKVPDRLDKLTIIMTIDSDNRNEIELIAKGMISKVNQGYLMQGYDAERAFVIGSDNGYKNRFYISITPLELNGDSAICDENKAEENEYPTLETLTIGLIKVLRERDRIKTAFVNRSDILGLEFLENHISKEDDVQYILK